MKKYKLKEEVKKYINEGYHETIGSADWWLKEIALRLNALEEVEERIELELCNIGTATNTRLQKKKLNGFTDQESQLCEAILNASDGVKGAVLYGGELFTKDGLYQFAQNCLNKCEGEYFSPDLLDSIFKEIKEKK